MNNAALWPLLLVVLGGMASATQAPINAVLARATGSFVLTAAISFGIGFVVLMALAAVRGNFSTMGSFQDVPWWAWTGGICGAFFVWSSVSGVGALGAVTLIAGLVLGQMLAALALDATGAFGLVVQPISWTRIGAVALVFCGLLLSRF